MKKINSRKLAYLILKDIEKEKLTVKDSLDKWLSKYKIDNRDENLVRKIVYGCIENKMLLDYYINQLVNNKPDLDVKILIEIGMYQILFLDKIPNSAAVNESVKIIKKINFKAKGFVNGVLRNFIRRKDKLKLKKTKKNYLSLKYSYPSWLVNYFLDEFGKKKTIEILEFNKNSSDITVRVNSLKLNRKELIQGFNDYGIKAKKSKLTKSGIIIKSLNDNSLTNNKLFKEGKFYIQDDASILVSEILNPKKGQRVLDVCAAPGGKTTHMAELMDNTGKIIARDLNDKKLSLIKENIKRLGYENIILEKFNGTKLDKKNIESFDKILLDAPCLGLGIIRRKPEIKYNKKKSDFNSIINLQKKLLKNSSKLLKKGGHLVYSTCSIGRKENDKIVNEFLNNNKNFKLELIEKLLPGEKNTDGFFIAKLIKQ